MTIRKADISDLNNLTKLFEGYRNFYRQPSNYDKAYQFLKERFEKKESVVYVAENENQELIGFTQLYPIFTSTRLERAWLLNDLFVMHSGRGKGISKKLIQAAKDHCVETKAYGIMLETERTNIIGNKLYPSVGFEKEKGNFYYWTNK
ncbi:MAG: GNAT family N-acetyltransferase [Winogradskyella sp.]|nr:GNAT family N-acetyltransferase [Winogradskyella sp.]